MNTYNQKMSTHITFENRKQVIDSETGELIEYISETKGIIPREPDYVKLYLADISYLNALPKGITGILYELLRKMDYEGRIILNAGLKREIALTLGTTVQNIENAISKFSKKNILMRKDTGIYLANPWLFGKGKWENIRQIRLNVIYNLDGSRTIGADIEREDSNIEQE